MKTKNSKNVCVISLCCILLTYNTDSIITHASDYSSPPLVMNRQILLQHLSG